MISGLTICFAIHRLCYYSNEIFDVLSSILARISETDWLKNVILKKQFCDETLALSCEQSRKNQVFTVGVHTSVVSADV